jgi:Mg-chelatase subunit ChlD
LDAGDVTDKMKDAQVQHAGALLDLVGNAPAEATKLFILIHGWNSDATETPYATGTWAAVVNAWADSFDQHQGWCFMGYDWHEDAATGPVGKKAAEYGTRAAERAYWHGQALGELLVNRFKRLEEVQFVAHSAGAWAARSAALYLAQQRKTHIQLTLLDPYMPSWPAGSVLGRDLMNRLDAEEAWKAGQLVLLENYFTKDKSLWSTETEFDWTAAPSCQAVVNYNRIEKVVKDMAPDKAKEINIALQVVRFLNGHGMPIAWYAATMQAAHCYPQGWALSMPYLEAQTTQPSNGCVVAIVDESGSMAGRKMDLAKQGVCLLKELMQTRMYDYELGLVGFSDTGRLLCPPRPVMALDRTDLGVDLLGKGGNTAIGLGIHEGLLCARQSTRTERSLVLLSDGEHNTGELWPYVEEASRYGIPIHAINLDAGSASAVTLQRIASQTGGDYFDADAENIQQVYASINAKMNGQCVLLYKTDVIRQDGIIEYGLSLLPKLFSSSIILSWPGSRLDLQIRDSTGADVSQKYLSHVKRASNYFTASLSELPDSRYTIRIIGADVSESGEPFVLQVLTRHPKGIYVKPMRASYRVGEDIRISGNVSKKMAGSPIRFDIEFPGGLSMSVPATYRAKPSEGGLWDVIFPEPEDIGVYHVTGRVGGEVIYLGSYRCGSIEEVMSRRLSALAQIDRARLLLRQRLTSGNEHNILKRYTALTYAANLARTVQALDPVWKEITKDGHSRPDDIQRLVDVLLPFAGKSGIDSISLVSQGHILMSTRSSFRGDSLPLPEDESFREQGGMYWIRMPLLRQRENTLAFLVCVTPLADEMVGPFYKAYATPGRLRNWESLNTKIQMVANTDLIEVMAMVEKSVWGGTIERTTANKGYRALMSLYPGYFSYLTIRDRNGVEIFRGSEQEDSGILDERHNKTTILLPVIVNGQTLSRISARILSVVPGA